MTLLDDLVTDVYRHAIGFPTLKHRPEDYLTAFADDPELVAAARAEVVRLAEPGGNRVLAEHDHESKVRHDTLVRMLATFDARGGS